MNNKTINTSENILLRALSNLHNKIIGLVIKEKKIIGFVVEQDGNMIKYIYINHMLVYSETTININKLDTLNQQYINFLKETEGKHYNYRSFREDISLFLSFYERHLTKKNLK